MTTYVIGDVQGCFNAFQALLLKLDFNIKKDRIWLVGDVVNRGNGSLEMLRWCVEHQDHIQVVLGNHDLHTLVVANGIVTARKSDTLDALLAANDRDHLLEWLRFQPVMHYELGYVMVHAGLLPQWTVEMALAYAKEVEQALKAENYVDFLRHMYGNQPAAWDDHLQGWDRLRVITNAFTRLRICNVEGEMEFDFKGELSDIPEGYMPWFDVPNRLSLQTPIVFGHWSALGLQHRNQVYALDTGCLWGRQLTAYAIETKAIIQVPCDPRDSNQIKHF